MKRKLMRINKHFRKVQIMHKSVKIFTILAVILSKGGYALPGVVVSRQVIPQVATR